MPGTSQSTSKSETTLRITRTFDAPPERVFDAWLDAGQLARWIGPRDMVFTWAWEHEGHETLVTLTFRAVGKGTEMTMLHENFQNADRRDSHNNGWTKSFEQLAGALGGGLQ